MLTQTSTLQFYWPRIFTQRPHSEVMDYFCQRRGKDVLSREAVRSRCFVRIDADSSWLFACETRFPSALKSIKCSRSGRNSRVRTKFRDLWDIQHCWVCVINVCNTVKCTVSLSARFVSVPEGRLLLIGALFSVALVTDCHCMDCLPHCIVGY